MQVGATVLACSAIDLLKNPQVLEDAKKELADALGSRKYRPLLSDSTAPPVNINEKTMDKYRSLMAEFYKDNPAAR
jgi:hypothetical protein